MVEIGNKYGCLTVLDSGEEYENTEYYKKSFEQYNGLIEINAEFLSELDSMKDLLADYPYKEMYEHKMPRDSKFDEIVRAFYNKAYLNPDYRKIKDLKNKLARHYKCKCKCGKIGYYNEITLEKKPKYCFYPVSIANLQFSYSNKAKNANERKRKQYENDNSVKLWSKNPAGAPWYWEQEVIDESLPSDEYCEIYNRYKAKQLEKQKAEYDEMISKLPRHYADNFNVDYKGRYYESLYVSECVNEHLESQPRPYYTQISYNGKRKHWADITVYKQYKCVCKLCRKEYLVNCDKFGIYPPTDYGYNAYHGYWSQISCDCHPISSFQWIVCKILFDNNVDYEVEYSFDDLYGIAGKSLLRYDFAIMDNGKPVCLIECQGEQHFEPVEEFGGKEQYMKQVENDKIKRKYAKAHNISLIEISYKQKDYDIITDILKENNIIL
jgi:hypothetical protein